MVAARSSTVVTSLDSQAAVGRGRAHSCKICFGRRILAFHWWWVNGVAFPGMKEVVHREGVVGDSGHLTWGISEGVCQDARGGAR